MQLFFVRPSGVFLGLSKRDFWNLWKILVRHGHFFLTTFFFEMKNFLEKIENLVFWKIFIFSIEKLIFSSKNFTWKNRFFYWKNENFSKKSFSIFFKKIFHLEKKKFSKIFLSISIRNFPKIPKIALRKSCDACKHV